MQGIDVRLSLYEDGQAVTRDCAEDPLDRWGLHASHQVDVTMGGKTVSIHQAPQSLTPSAIGVGAVVWEGELLMGQYLCSVPRHRFLGCRVVELGAGPGLLGLLLAKWGARQVVITDKGSVLPLIRKNVELNGLGDKGQLRGQVEVAELEWGKQGYETALGSIAQDPVDWVLAADCLYIDNEGQSPSIPHFVKACSILCGSNARETKCLVSFELRSEEVKHQFLQAVAENKMKAKLIPRSSLPRGCQIDYIELYELTKG
ncbi:putative methyltransferase-domain-containing protein [Dunaliella salina]|uniref:Methyltransferase-domain-containing protein n=1 Tax=Dunaliella salina TaxID=3046 RepID=A0ABQ7FU98_DUNSA|nr:putative methyltransferase-domain-containing protein [Dunaliella salina]KAF5825993.1 putative methyltransferase-domain-containing protein [Dunaliella salina]KAF5825994.1 putative methyltransferase-domain-containing protein [Dunaliella salina]|eukprot:KAF5825992.1 putative methyltransferase-domain-containing protein [Dunaliella salina]